MRNNVQQLAKLQANLDAAREELEAINKEETLLQWQPTSFPQLQQMFQAKKPYDKLWNTLLNFTEKHEKWMKGRGS
jgi:dynein heavy chain